MVKSGYSILAVDALSQAIALAVLRLRSPLVDGSAGNWLEKVTDQQYRPTT
jgi:hypothetical protein